MPDRALQQSASWVIDALHERLENQRIEIERLNVVIHQLAAEGVKACAAMRELLSGHDNLYRAHWGHLPTCDPTDDIAAKAARAFLDE